MYDTPQKKYVGQRAVNMEAKLHEYQMLLKSIVGGKSYGINTAVLWRK